MVREKIIHEMKLIPQNVVLDENNQQVTTSVVVELTTSAGTYVKEFMHGDEGRTVPFMGGMLDGGNVTVVSLDVLHVFLDWPPPVSFDEDVLR